MDDERKFGSRLVVRAETVRLIAQPEGDSHRFKQAVPKSIGTGRFAVREFPDGDDWPGAPIDETWEPGPRGYQVTPVLNGRVLARVRRLPFDVEQVGVLIGFTHRQEGIIATVDGTTALYPPTRTIPLYEVALAPLRPNGKARLVLVHRHDAAELPPEMRT